MSKDKKKLTHIDLFAGVGGICTGFKAAGFETVVAVEHVDTCTETYLANHPEVDVILDDIRNVQASKIKSLLKKKGLKRVDVVTAGFPCETFSTAGSNSRVYDDHRNYLYQDAIRIADAAQAQILVLENVPAFTSKRVSHDSKELILEHLISDLESAGYKYWDYDILNAADYGVPQRRERFIMFASKEIPVRKEMFNAAKKNFFVTVDDALSDLPHIDQGDESIKYDKPKNNYQKQQRSKSFWKQTVQKPNHLTYHITTKHRPATIKRFELIKHGEGLKDLFDKLSDKEKLVLQEEKILPKKWYIQRNHRLTPNKQSKTVTSHCVEEIIHPYLNRSLSVREAARLQSFPDYYDFAGGPLICPHIYHTQDKYEQIGDAVPPLLAKHIGESIKRILN